MSLINYTCAWTCSCAFSTHTEKATSFSLWQNHRKRQTSTSSYTLAQVRPTRATVSPQGTLGNVQRHLWLSQLNGRGTAGTCVHTGRLLYLLQCAGQYPQHRAAWPQMSKAKVEKVSIQPKLKLKLCTKPSPHPQITSLGHNLVFLKNISFFNIYMLLAVYAPLLQMNQLLLSKLSWTNEHFLNSGDFTSSSLQCLNIDNEFSPLKFKPDDLNWRTFNLLK